MNTINNSQSINKLFTHNSGQTTEVRKRHRGMHKIEGQNSKELTKKGLDFSNNSPRCVPEKFASPIDDLVSNGTITKEQKDAIENAFLSMKQSNVSGYGGYKNKSVNPMESLVTSGIITKDQQIAIKNALDTAMKSPILPSTENE